MSVTSIRKKTAERMGDGACRKCGVATAYATLSSYGAQCFPCYEAYCREPMPTPERSQAAQRIRAEIEAMGKSLSA